MLARALEGSEAGRVSGWRTSVEPAAHRWYPIAVHAPWRDGRVVYCGRLENGSPRGPGVRIPLPPPKTPAPRTSPVGPVSLIILTLVLGLAACGPRSRAATRNMLPTPAATPDPRALAVDAFLTQQLQDKRFNGSVAIVRDGHMLLSKGYGMADWERGVANTPETEFRLGSLTKQFTAMAILLLRHDGKLALGDPICHYVPSCPDSWRPITIEELLTHTSGIPDLADGDISDYSQPMTPAQLVALIETKPLAFAPGSSFLYSSAGYNVLGYIVERASGLSYADFLRARIFAPLGMSNTGFDVDHPSLPAHATGYASWQAPAGYFDISLGLGAGSLESTADDLVRWDHALYSNTLLPQADIQAALSPRVGVCGQGCQDGLSNVGYGYGWFVGSGPYGTVEYHIGDVLGFKTLIARYPASKSAIILLSNVENLNVVGLLSALERLAIS